MKIVYLHQYFRTPDMYGGARSFEMARRLVDRGHQVHMITSDAEPRGRVGGRWYVSDEAGIRVHWVPVPYSNKMSYRQRIAAFRQFARHAAHKAVELEGDLVFATSTPLTIALPGIYASRRLRVPLVFEVRDLWPELPIAVGALKSRTSIAAAHVLEWLAYRSSAHIVALSPGMKDGVLRRGIEPDRVSVIPNGCDFEMFDVPRERGREFRQRHEWLADRKLVVYTGMLGMINGVGYLPRLAAEVAKMDAEIRFLVVGTGWEEEAVRREAARLGVLGRSFFMHREIAKREIPGVLAAADMATSLFVDLPEMWANSANKFFDALASGTPVAVNHGGWLADLVEQRKMGLVLDPKDMRRAAESLVGLINDPLRLAESARAARHAGRELFDRDRLATQLENVLLRALKQRTPAVASRVKLGSKVRLNTR